MRKLIVSLTLALATMAGCAAPCHAPQIAESCVVIRDPEPGWDYRHGAWYDADGQLVGYATYEDSPIYSAYCVH